MLRSAFDRERLELQERAKTLFEDHPVAVVAAGFGLGFVLGGGLLSRAAIPALGLCARAYAGDLLGRVLSGVEQGGAAVPE
jgi:hypothetical protein